MNKKYIFILIIIIWVFFLSLIIVGNNYTPDTWGEVCEFIQISLTGLITFLLIRLYVLIDNKNKKIFLFYIYSTVFLFISSSTYFFCNYVLLTTNINSINITWIYLAPAMLWLLFDFIYWTKVITIYENIFKNKLLLATLIIVNICFFFVVKEVFSYWDITMNIFTIIFQIYSSMLIFFTFNFALIALICSRTLGAHLLSAGTISTIGANFLTMYVSYSHSMDAMIYKNDFWLISSLITISGILLIISNKNYDMFSWFAKGNSIKSTVASWTLCIVSITFSLSFALASYFSLLNLSALPTLPYVTFIYIIAAVLISVAFANLFELPFSLLNKSINKFISSGEILKINENKIKLSEFAFLHKFLNQAFSIAKERDLLRQTISDNSAQVSHDIRSPLSALRILTSDHIDIPDRPKRLIINAVDRINDIVNELDNNQIVDMKLPFKSVNEISYIAPLISSIVTEKRIQYSQEKDIIIIFEINENNYSIFTEINIIEFKRALSNLITNSVESLKNKTGLIEIKLFKNSSFKFTIIINDNGKGIEANKIAYIFDKNISYYKKNGTGLGLYHAKETVKRLNGEIDITSVIGKGTSISLLLPKAPIPKWFAEELTINTNVNIIVIDNDISVYELWLEKLSYISNLNITYISSSYKFDKWWDIDRAKSKKYLYLIDYDLSNNMNGVEIINKYSIENLSVLVTSKYNVIIQKFNYIKIIPKDFISYLPIKVVP